MNGNKWTGLIAAACIALLAAMLFAVTHGDKDKADLLKYTARATLLESKDKDHGLDIAEQSELSELKARIGKMKADGLR